jgi:hypothetical protein
MKDKIYNCYKKYIIHFAELKYPEVRKRKYSFHYYLSNFIYVLNDVTKWEALKHINKEQKSFHWKSIYNEYKKWSFDNIFENAYKSFLQNHYFKISKVRKNKKINILIDVTKITNKSGSEKIGINVEYKKKNVTCLSVVCDEEKIPIGISYLETNLNKTKTGKHSFVHELKGAQKTLDSIPFKFKKYVKVNLIGDKGYISQKKFSIFDKKVKIITPYRKNQKKKNTKIEKNLLAKRHKIENLFASLKRKDRVNIRKDRKINCYMSFVYMTLIENLFETANKKGKKITY